MEFLKNIGKIFLVFFAFILFLRLVGFLAGAGPLGFIGLLIIIAFFIKRQ